MTGLPGRFAASGSDGSVLEKHSHAPIRRRFSLSAESESGAIDFICIELRQHVGALNALQTEIISTFKSRGIQNIKILNYNYSACLITIGPQRQRCENHQTHHLSHISAGFPNIQGRFPLQNASSARCKLETSPFNLLNLEKKTASW